MHHCMLSCTGSVFEELTAVVVCGTEPVHDPWLLVMTAGRSRSRLALILHRPLPRYWMRLSCIWMSISHEILYYMTMPDLLY